ncbi:carboxypeptidase regulatory-like domain-containing protein [Candidatus Falkowbacteria bacterium]|nr:carboxypeptidase regulatory-like domain-containing protein [Candidatus Falkowbacteria bacterium]
MFSNKCFFVFLIAFIIALSFVITTQWAPAAAQENTGPIISDIRVENITGSGAQIKWTTDQPSDSRVAYGTSPGQYALSDNRCDGGGNVTSHCVNLMNLNYNTVYYYKVKSMNAMGFDSHSNEFQFTSASAANAPDTPGSVPAAPYNLVADTDGVTVKLTWSDPSLNKTETKIYRRQSDTAWMYLNSTGIDITWYTDSSVPSGNYEYQVFSCNSYGCSNGSNIAAINIVSGGVIQGEVTDGGGAIVANAHVEAQAIDSKMSYWGKADNQGLYTINIPVGTYKIIAQPPEGASLLSSLPIEITIVSGQTLTQNLVLASASKTISGKVSRSDGTAVANAGIHAYQSASGRSAQAITDASGNYTLGVGGGAWEVSVFSQSPSDDWRYNQPPQTLTFAVDDAPETKTLNFTVVTVDAAVKGKILKPDGTAPAANAISINLDNSQGFAFGASVDATGSFSIAVPAGTYNVFIHSQDQTLIAPALSAITVSSGQTKDLGTITLVKATKSIKGKVARQDGRAVTDAAVGAFHKETQKWIETKVDGSGNYSLLATGGSWEVSVRPITATPNWTYDKSSQIVVFNQDTTVEEKIINFTVTTTDVFVKGKILLPGGTIPAANSVFVDLRSATGFGFGGSIDSSGAFRISLTAGTYNIFIHSENQDFSTPALSSITVVSGETKDLGAIYLLARVDHIKGRVTDKNGQGVGGIIIDAWMPEGSDHAMTKTDSTGNYDLSVIPGKWEVQAMPDAAFNFYNPEPPKQINVVSGTAAVVNFTLYPADAGISGTLVDKQGNVLTELYGYVGLSQEVKFGPGLGGPIERGKFFFKAPAGTYVLSVFLPPDSLYTIGLPQTVTLVAGETIFTQVVVVANTSKITGTLKDEAGKPVTGFDAKVFATTQIGVWQGAIFDKTTGQYTLRVAAGIWYLGYDIDSTSGYMSLHKMDIQVVIGEEETMLKDLIVIKANSVIAGRITDPNGIGVSRAFVGVSKTSFSALTQNQEFKDPMVAGAETDGNGFYRLSVPAGSYFIKTFVSPKLGFINSEEKSVSLTDGQTLTLNLQLRSASLKITGRALLNDRPISGAFVWGWSQKGGYQETFSRIDGGFQLNVTANDVWTIAAGREIEGVFYKSSEVGLRVGDADLAQDIYLAKFVQLPSSVIQTAEATKPAVVEVINGPTVVAPANAVSTSGSISISIAPDSRAPSQGEIRIVGVAYNFEARDANDQLVPLFNTEVVITIPYNTNEVTNLGTREENLLMAFWDETNGTWKTVDKSVVNQDKNCVTAAVNHFTRFAIVSAADIIPPSAPAKITAIEIAPGQVKLGWQNPVQDFHHAKIYRSTESGKLGALIYNDLTGTSRIDSGLSGEKTYYFVVRAVDPAGNESTNQDAIAVLVEVGGEQVVAASLFKSSGSAIWVVNNGLKSLIRSVAVFNDSGYDWGAVQTISNSRLNAIPIANLIKTADSPDVYRLEKNFKRKLASIEIFESYGLDWNKISIVSQPMMDSFSYAPIYQKKGAGGLYWKDANNALHQFVSMPVFAACGYNVRDLIAVNKMEFGSFAIGETIIKP